MTKRRVPNVVRGGVAIPLKGKTNYYYMSGRKHTNGGIDIGNNPKTGIEVEDGEVMHITKDGAKVFSAVPFLNGKSPAQKVMGGENPNKIFKAQERFKRINKINDDGSHKKQLGGDENIDFTNLSTTKNRPYNINNLNRIYRSLNNNKSLNNAQKAAILATIVEESGANPGAIDETKEFNGLLQWSNERFPVKITGNDKVDIDNQLNKIFYKTIDNTTDRVSWTHGGKGSGYKSAKDSHNAFKTATTVSRATHALNRGYVRPTGKNASVRNRARVAYQIYRRLPREDNDYNFFKDVDQIIKDPFSMTPSRGKGIIDVKKYGGNSKFYSVTDRGKTRHYMIPSTGKPSARSAEVRTKKFLGGYDSFKDWWKDNDTNVISDGIGLVSNITGGLISHAVNKRMMNNLKSTPQPIPLKAAKLKTNININPQLDKMRETVEAYSRNVDNNTSSSNVALARKQRAKLANVIDTAELYGNKELAETTLINKDKLNQQTTAQKNVTNYNTWAEKDTLFKNNILEKQSENTVNTINAINAGVQNMLTIRDKRNAENQTIAAMALSNPNLPVEMFYEQGLIKKKLYDAYRKAYPNKTTTNSTNP